MTPEERNARSARIRELLDHPDVKDVFSEVESDLTGEWKRTFDTPGRENLWQAIRALGLIQAKLASWSHADLSAFKRSK